MKKYLFFVLILFGVLFGYTRFSQASSYSPDGTYTLFDGDEVHLDNDVWVRPSIFYAYESLISLVFYTGSINDTSSEAIIGTDFLGKNDSKTQELEQGSVSYTVTDIDRSSSVPSITVSFTSGSAPALKVSNLNVKLLNTNFDDGPATFITWDTNFQTTNRVDACEYKNCENPNIAETVSFNQDLEFERPVYESHMAQHRKLKYNTTYYYKIRGETSLGNAVEYPSGSDNWLTFTTGAEPKSSFIPKIGYFQNMVIVEWTTEKDSTSRILYGEGDTNRDYRVDISPTKNHKAQIPLEVGIEYKLKIESYTDNALSFSDVYTVMIAYNPKLNLNEPPKYTEDKSAVETVTQKVVQKDNEITSIQDNSVVDDGLVSRLKGNILLQVEGNGEAWYVDPTSRHRYYLKNGNTAYEALKKFGLGVTNQDLEKIPIGIESRFSDIDSDNDGLADKLEEALGTDISNIDSDGDGYTDGEEVENGFNPLGSGKLNRDTSYADGLKGKILLQVQSRGEAWYVNPSDGKRYYMKNGDAAYQIMRFLSLGITNENLNKIPSSEF